MIVICSTPNIHKRRYLQRRGQKHKKLESEQENQETKRKKEPPKTKNKHENKTKGVEFLALKFKI